MRMLLEYIRLLYRRMALTSSYISREQKHLQHPWIVVVNCQMMYYFFSQLGSSDRSPGAHTITSITPWWQKFCDENICIVWVCVCVCVYAWRRCINSRERGKCSMVYSLVVIDQIPGTTKACTCRIHRSYARGYIKGFWTEPISNVINQSCFCAGIRTYFRTSHMIISTVAESPEHTLLCHWYMYIYIYYIFFAYPIYYLRTSSRSPSNS